MRCDGILEKRRLHSLPIRGARPADDLVEQLILENDLGTSREAKSFEPEKSRQYERLANKGSLRQPAFATLAALPSNVRAIESAMQFSTGANDFVAIFGPSGWGKSHLLRAAAERIETLNGKHSALLLNAEEWIRHPITRDTNCPLLLDNVQDALDSGRRRQVLMLAIERRLRSGRPTMLAITSNAPLSTATRILPASKSWSKVGISPASNSEREMLVDHICDIEGIQIHQAIKRHISHTVRGNAGTILAALRTLSISRRLWTDEGSVLRAFAVLEPYFADIPSWDLRETISSSNPNRNVEREIYIMLHIAQLSEADVADYYEIAPGLAYIIASDFANSLYSDSEVQQGLLNHVSYTARKLIG